jgi:hypothetical protein
VQVRVEISVLSEVEVIGLHSDLKLTERRLPFVLKFGLEKT